MSFIEAFRKQLTIFEKYLKKLKFFIFCTELTDEFHERFRKISRPYSDSFVDTVANKTDQDPEFQMELCDLQSDILLSLNTIL